MLFAINFLHAHGYSSKKQVLSGPEWPVRDIFSGFRGTGCRCAPPPEEEAETPEEAVPTEEAPEAPAEETAAPASDETDAPEAE